MAAAEDDAPDDDAHIIASVRRILGEDASRPRAGTVSPPVNDVFELEPSMMVDPTPAAGGQEGKPHEAEELPPDMAAWASEWADDAPEAAPVPAPHVEAAPIEAAPPPPPSPPAAATTSPRPAPPPAPPLDEAEPADERMVGERSAEAAGQSFGSLRETLRAQRQATSNAAATAGLATNSHPGGPTIEEMIRQELRPLLKLWLDAHLPDLVERVVRAEIARIVEDTGA